MPNANLPGSAYPGRTMFAVVAEHNELNDYHAMFKFEKDAEEEAERLNGQEAATYRVVSCWVTERYQEGNQ